LSNIFKSIYPSKVPIPKVPISAPPPPAPTGLGASVGGVGAYTNRPARNELRGYRRWGYPGAFGLPTALLWAEAALVDAEDEDDLADLEAVEEDLWGS
jgi:hypothetical protein